MNDHETLSQQVKQATRSIAPLWPLTHFVAVNPFQGYADRPIWEASEHLKRVNGDFPLPSLAWLLEQRESGSVSMDDLQAAMEEASPAIVDAFTERELPYDSETVIRLSNLCQAPPQQEFQLGTFSAFMDRREGTRWNHLLKQEAAKWCAAQFDQGQSIWSSPWRGEGLFSAWKSAASIDRTLALNGLRNAPATIAALPEQPLDAIAYALRQLAVPCERAADILERAFLELPGWSGYLRYLDREKELRGGSGDHCLQLLAALLGYELILYRNFCDDKDRILAWKRSLLEDPADTGASAIPMELALRLLWLSAVERSAAERLRANVRPAETSSTKQDRPELQAVFCIDVRSERFRRNLEAVMPRAQTIGFAGFFGIPAEHHLPGKPSTRALCPVLLAPPVKTASGASTFQCEEWIYLETKAELDANRRGGWRRFRESAASCFTFVEAFGLSYLGKLLKDGFALNGRSTADRPGAAPRFVAAVQLAQRLDLAESILKGITLTRNFAPVVLICGHGSESANNPYASGLDCGACGGHAGDVNARLAASLLNDSAIRSGLKVRGIEIPPDTAFVAGLHNTTTDEVTLFEDDAMPSDCARKLAAARESLKQAGDLSLLERRAALGIDARERRASRIRSRSRDWSQVRPEWGLAGNEAFIVAPRSWTRASDLQGKAFLHEYDAGADPDGAQLEGILAGPLVVGSWISLQYFASAVDNETYGSGHKTIHNVVGGIGVAAGNENDLRVGLPWQSVHDGAAFVHRPSRLIACVAADPETLDRILDRQTHLRHLVVNQWIHIIALGAKGNRWLRRDERGSWLDWKTPSVAASSGNTKDRAAAMA